MISVCCIVCGDEMCEETEDCMTCPSDCGKCPLSVAEISAIAATLLLVLAAILGLFIVRTQTALLLLPALLTYMMDTHLILIGRLVAFITAIVKDSPFPSHERVKPSSKRTACKQGLGALTAHSVLKCNASH